MHSALAQRPPRATVKEMTKFHSDEYIDFLYRVTPENMNDFPKHQHKFNVGEDCPVFDGIYEFSSISAGGSIGALFHFVSLMRLIWIEFPI